jgi:hypothetical protein
MAVSSSRKRPLAVESYNIGAIAMTCYEPETKEFSRKRFKKTAGMYSGHK